mmetsp:Transcript_4365/g.9480  ORF Transcript_4365/g.9480 Transcript_4365/m.9480 type:complete len:764 (+) Transcript_4365:77-2368(+)
MAKKKSKKKSSRSRGSVGDQRGCEIESAQRSAGPRGRGKRKRSFDRGGRDATGSDKGGSSRIGDARGVRVMDDVLAQLRKQRAKAKAEKVGAAQEAMTGIEDVTDVQEEQNLKQRGRKAKTKDMGMYRYDPMKKTYFPVAATRRYDPHGVRNCISDNDNTTMTRQDGRNDATTFKNITGATLTLSTCPNLRNVRLGAATTPISLRRRNRVQLMVHAYQISSEITPSLRRRHDLRSEMMSAVLVSNGPRLVPAVRRVVVREGEIVGSRGKSVLVRGADVTYGEDRDSHCGEDCDTHCSAVGEIPSARHFKWVSLLKPLPLGPSQSSRGTPLDCGCKEVLHPSARTFDVMDSQGSSMMPHIVTISGGRDCSAITYREPETSIRPYPLGEDALGTNGSAVSQPPESNRRYNAVRFAPFMADGPVPTAIFGAISSSSRRRQENHSIFTLHRGPSEVDAAAPFASTDLQLPGNDTTTHMNDFVFSPGSSSSAPGIVAFAPGKGSNNKQCRPAFLDFSTMQLTIQPRGWKFGSETLCVEHFEADSPNTLVYGHRNGAISLLDYRSNTFSYTSKGDKLGFGSTMSISSLARCGKPHLFLAKGSFGTCRLYDVRTLGELNTEANQTPTLIHDMSSASNCGQSTLASACSGMAVDPTGTTLFSPCTSTVGDATSIGVWNISTGRLIREISLLPHLYQEVHGRSTNEKVGTLVEERGKEHRWCSSYCELASSITRTVDWNESGSDGFGAWIKFDPQVSAPTEGGGIHCVKFST